MGYSINGVVWTSGGGFKPIFHCDAKPFALGPGIGLDHQRHNLALGMLVSKSTKICVTPNAKFKFVLPPMEYRLRYVPNAKFSHWPCTLHVVYAHFICVGYPVCSGIWA